MTDSGPLHEILGRIENRAAYGEPATGRSLTDEFSREPFGWDFDVVRLLVVALLRAGKIEATSQGKVIDSARSLDAGNNLPNNNLFRQASFRPKVGLDYTRVVDAYSNRCSVQTEIAASAWAQAFEGSRRNWCSIAA